VLVTQELTNRHGVFIRKNLFFSNLSELFKKAGRNVGYPRHNITLL